MRWCCGEHCPSIYTQLSSCNVAKGTRVVCMEMKAQIRAVTALVILLFGVTVVRTEVYFTSLSRYLWMAQLLINTIHESKPPSRFL